jgi:hypothetical protein
MAPQPAASLNFTEFSPVAFHHIRMALAMR